MSGVTAAPSPWMTLRAIARPLDSATAHMSEPIANAASEASSIRRFPNMSPSRPTSGIATIEASTNPVTIHAIEPIEAP